MMTAAQKRHYEKNKEAMRKRAAEWRKNNPTLRKLVERRSHLKKTYGLTMDGFSAILAAQNGRCAICLRDTPSSNGWCVDHNHVNGRIRGVLCHRCNTALGLLQDNRMLLRRAEEYLAKTED